MTQPPELMSMAEFTEWMAAHGVKRTRHEWMRRARDGQFARKVGHSWIVTAAEAEAMLARLTGR